MQFNIAHQSPREIEDLNRLADEVVSTLVKAGISAAREEGAVDDHVGALIDVDPLPTTPVASSSAGAHTPSWQQRPDERLKPRSTPMPTWHSTGPLPKLWR
jgi:hypothetical protein